MTYKELEQKMDNVAHVIYMRNPDDSLAGYILTPEVLMSLLGEVYEDGYNKGMEEMTSD